MSGIKELKEEVAELRKLVMELLLRPVYVPYPQPMMPMQGNQPFPPTYTPYVSPYADTTTAEPPFPIFEDDLIPVSERVEEPPVKSPRAAYYAKITAKTSDSSLG